MENCAAAAGSKQDFVSFVLKLTVTGECFSLDGCATVAAAGAGGFGERAVGRSWKASHIHHTFVPFWESSSPFISRAAPAPAAACGVLVRAGCDSTRLGAKHFEYQSGSRTHSDLLKSAELQLRPEEQKEKEEKQKQDQEEEEVLVVCLPAFPLRTLLCLFA